MSDDWRGQLIAWHSGGPDCLLCILAATAANSTRGKHAETLSLEDFTTVKTQLAAALRDWR